ncbi:carboxypeptidase-like regulatory domain-containing protein [Mucilaginibacter sp. 21P]|uniref:carboxypeptidase regulatory-like domain-containing protein n=1 Tax=Mucilaginibacter sp. 21P TaxID=2778902 RepID=UPI001C598EEC|nr:carboxypeptidase regulatory-like domain-containing protein [Mucilaginibacter sp. 21P]QXV63736.1 carboxypeptidase-like regulatory domain-containing protein [Mucilaginibacter sp. 21P]
MAQSARLTGAVTDSSGVALKGATVSLGSSQTVTDTAGKFSIVAAPGDYILKVSYLGYRSVSEAVRLPRVAP